VTDDGPIAGAVLAMEAAIAKYYEDTWPRTPEHDRIRKVARNLAIADGERDNLDRVVMGYPQADPSKTSALYFHRNGTVAFRLPIQPLWVTYVNAARDAIEATKDE